MVATASPIGLKTKLAGCITNPIILLPILLLIFFINLMKIFQPFIQSINIPSPEPLLVPVVTTTTSLRLATSTIFESMDIPELVTNYVNNTVHENARLINLDIKNRVEPYVSQSIQNWNNSLYNVNLLENEKASNLSSLYSEINANLKAQSQRINETISKLAENGLLISTSSEPDGFVDLYLDYKTVDDIILSFIDSYWQKTSLDSLKLPHVYFDKFNISDIMNTTLLNTFINELTELLRSQENFSKSAYILKRQTTEKQCKHLHVSIILISIYPLFIGGCMVVEWLSHRIKSDLIGKAINVILFNDKDNCSKFEKYNNLKPELLLLVDSTSRPISVKISKLSIYLISKLPSLRKSNERNPENKKIVENKIDRVCWWLFHRWLFQWWFLLFILVSWAVTMVLIPDINNDALSKRALVARNSKDALQNIINLSETFQSSFTSSLNTTTQSFYFNSVYISIDNINKEMNELISSLTSESSLFVPWKNVTKFPATSSLQLNITGFISDILRPRTSSAEKLFYLDKRDTIKEYKLRSPLNTLFKRSIGVWICINALQVVISFIF